MWCASEYNFIEDLIGIPYKKEPPFSLELGMNCLAWVSHIYELCGIKIFKNFNNLRYWRENFNKVSDQPKFLDIILLYSTAIGERHVGVMLDNYRMSQCSSITNGVAICDITRMPWKHSIKGFYKYK